MIWVENDRQRLQPANIRRTWSLLHDRNTAVGMVSEMADGTYRVVYSRAGSTVMTYPEVIEDLATLDEAQSRAEEIVRNTLIQPRVVLLDA